MEKLSNINKMLKGRPISF